ncbi:MAG: WYL domain-containing protein [Bacteroidaceae bacterium]|nr:WYL domain-containing protein [Bacteroidaceae bacterium]
MTSEVNIFKTKGELGKMIRCFYNLVRTGEVVTYHDLLVAFDDGVEFDYPHSCHPKFNNPGKKAVMAVKEAFKENGLEIKSIKNGKTIGFQYMGTDKNPFWKIYHRAILLERYEIMRKCCDEKRCAQFFYRPFGKKEREYIFHPHKTIEYNERLFAIGVCEQNGKDIQRRCVVALDRIKGEIMQYERIQHKFIRPEDGEYDYLNHLVGISLPVNAEIVTVTLRAHGKYMFGLIKTKPIHDSQHVVNYPSWNEGREYGDFEVILYPNNEFYGKVLQMGASLEILHPEHVRNEMANRIRNLSTRYEN